MARLTTWGAIKTAALQLADEVNSGFFTTAMLDGWLNDSVGELYAMLVEADPDTYTATDSVATTSGTTLYNLASNFWKCRGVDVDLNGSTVVVPSFSWLERDRFYRAVNYQQYLNPGVAYCIRGNSILFLPDPLDRTYTVHYIPAPDIYDNDADTLDGFAGFEAWLKYDLAIKICMRAETDPSIAVMERNRIGERIKKLGRDRDKAEAPRTSDTFFGG